MAALKHALALAALVGCRVASPTSLDVPPTPRRHVAVHEGPPLAIPATAIAWPRGTFAIASPKSAGAPWLLPPFDPGRAHPLEDLRLVASGDDVALARNGDLVVATRRKSGIAGRVLAPEDLSWIGIAGGDAIFAATNAGSLLRADTIDHALQSGFTKVGEVTGATLWDAAGPVIVAAIGHDVAVSSDGGATFRRSQPVEGGRIRSVAARHDGVIAILHAQKSSTRVMLSRDHGASWTKSSWQPTFIAREGAWIVGVDSRAGVLAADGRTWLAIEDAMHPTGGEAFETWSPDFGVFAITPTPRKDTRPRANEPASPSRGRRLVGRRSEARIEAFGAGGLGTAGSAGPCHGSKCLHGTLGASPPPSAIDVHAFDDLRCAIAADPCPDEAWRPGHLGVFDHRTASLEVAQLGEACREIHLQDLQGLMLASCRHPGGATLYAIDTHGRVAAELVAQGDDVPEWAVQYASMADDGTVLVPEDPSCERWARAWVRLPRGVGGEGLWREVYRERARAWRVLPAGGAAAIVQDEREAMHAELWVDRPGVAQARLLAAIDLDVELWGFQIVDGRVVFHSDRPLALAEDGSLVAIAALPRETVRTIDGIELTEARPFLRCD
jgi:hypothetical protein